MGLERKLAALSSLRPDIAILSEVACPERLRSQLPILEAMPIVFGQQGEQRPRCCVIHRQQARA
jgi:hypothetical protein